jgi:hypothetical protein
VRQKDRAGQKSGKHLIELVQGRRADAPTGHDMIATVIDKEQGLNNWPISANQKRLVRFGKFPKRTKVWPLAATWQMGNLFNSRS